MNNKNNFLFFFALALFSVFLISCGQYRLDGKYDYVQTNYEEITFEDFIRGNVKEKSNVCFVCSARYFNPNEGTNALELLGLPEVTAVEYLCDSRGNKIPVYYSSDARKFFEAKTWDKFGNKITKGLVKNDLVKIYGTYHKKKLYIQKYAF